MSEVHPLLNNNDLCFLDTFFLDYELMQYVFISLTEPPINQLWVQLEHLLLVYVGGKHKTVKRIKHHLKLSNEKEGVLNGGSADFLCHFAKTVNRYDTIITGYIFCISWIIPLMDCRLGRMVTAPSAISSWFSIGEILEPQLSEPTQMKWPVWLAFLAAWRSRLWDGEGEWWN